jgi:hypothetical protein
VVPATDVGLQHRIVKAVTRLRPSACGEPAPPGGGDAQRGATDHRTLTFMGILNTDREIQHDHHTGQDHSQGGRTLGVRIRGETYSPTFTRILNHAEALGINIHINSFLKAAN